MREGECFVGYLCVNVGDAGEDRSGHPGVQSNTGGRKHRSEQGAVPVPSAIDMYVSGTAPCLRRTAFLKKRHLSRTLRYRDKARSPSDSKRPVAETVRQFVM